MLEENPYNICLSKQATTMPSPATSSGEKVTVYPALTIELHNINMADSEGENSMLESMC